MAPARFCRLGLQFCGAAAAILVPMVGGWGGVGGGRDISLKARENLPLMVAVKEIAWAAIHDIGGQL